MREKNQVVLPLNLVACIPEGDFVFKVAEICESLDYTELFNTYLRVWRKVSPITMYVEYLKDLLISFLFSPISHVFSALALY